jgi:PLP dependent protein
MDRLAEIAANRAVVEQRISRACDAVGRRRAELTVVAVTKTFPASDVAHLASLGQRDMGENRHQDAAPKVAECAASGLTDLRWHFVGQLQTNKAAAVAAYCHVVHSVDRVRLVSALERGARESGRVLTCLVQVNLGGTAEAGRGGADPDQVLELSAALAESGSLALGGVMAVAPLDGDADRAFERLHQVAVAVRSAYPEAVMVSAGMSGDLEAAIAHGATHLRVGTALLGSRPPLR